MSRLEDFGIRIVESDAVEPNGALLVSACAQPDPSNCEKNETEFDRLLHAHGVHDAAKITGIV